MKRMLRLNNGSAFRHSSLLLSTAVLGATLSALSSRASRVHEFVLRNAAKFHPIPSNSAKFHPLCHGNSLRINHRPSKSGGGTKPKTFFSKARIFIPLLFVGLSVCSDAQQPFQNLQFDDGPYVAFLPVALISEYLPGWHLTYDGREVSTISINTFGHLGANGFNVLNGADRFYQEAPFDGRYTLWLQNGNLEGTVQTWEVFQDGIIPTDSRSIYFKVDPLGHVPSLRINDAELPLVHLGADGGFRVFGADVAVFAGQEARLTFYTRPEGYIHQYTFDSIGFSPVVIPEPTTFLLFILGVSIFGFQRRFSGGLRENSYLN